MDEVVRSEPIWADMYSAFRHVAVARVINQSVGKWWYVVGGDAGMEVLKNYKPTFVEVPKEMVFSDFRKLSMKNKKGGTSWTLNCMCGGIDTHGSVERSTNNHADVREIERLVLASRALCGSESWVVG
jgi:hypothetical protein